LACVEHVVLNGRFLSLKKWWQEQANAAMWRSIEQCHVDVMGRFDRELGQCLWFKNNYGDFLVGKIA